MTTVSDRAANILDPFGYWKEYPERDLEHVRRYPCIIDHLSEGEVWQKEPIILTCQIPFCHSTCVDADGHKELAAADQINRYVDALKREINTYAEQPYIQDHEVLAAHFAGCSPAALGIEQLQHLLDSCFESLIWKSKAPISINSSPVDISKEKAAALVELGVSAVHLQAHSFDDQVLERCGLPYRSEAIDTALQVLQIVGVTDTSLELTYGLPGETLASWKATVKRAATAPVESVSLRAFDAASGPSADSLKAWYELAADTLLAAGFAVVTSRHFVKPAAHTGATVFQISPQGYLGLMAGSAPKMILRVHSWVRGGDVLGVGAGASGYLKEHVYFNAHDLDAYLASVEGGTLPVESTRHVSAQERLAMTLVYALRLLRLSRAEFAEQHGMDVMVPFGKEIAELQSQGLLRVTDDMVEVTYPDGWIGMPTIRETILRKEGGTHGAQ